MKNKTINLLLMSFVLFTTLFLAACQDDAEKPSNTSDAVKKENVNKVLTFREDLNFVNRFVKKNITIPSEEGRIASGSAMIARIKESAPCTEATEEELPDGSLKITLNFGDGCEVEDGTEVAGTVIMIFAFHESTFEYSLEFIDYTEIGSGEYPGQIVNGTVSGSFVLDLESSKFTQEMEQDLKIKYPDNTVAGYKVAQAAEMTEDGLRVISLATSGNFGDGGVFTMTLSKNLVYDFACSGDFPIEGEEILIFQGNSVRVNYGNGTCDQEYSVK